MAPNAYYPQPAPPKKGFPVWLIVLLVTLLLIIIVVAVLALLAVVGVRKYVSNAKTAEAVAQVHMMSLDADTAFTADEKLCGSASAAVPASMSRVAGIKYMSSPSDWETDKKANAGFSCLKFEMMSPQYYQYDYHRTGAGAATGDTFIAIAHGDLDGNGVTSEFSMSGRVASATMLVIDPTVTQTNPAE